MEDLPFHRQPEGSQFSNVQARNVAFASSTTDASGP
jgi:hypothetical protein